MATPFERILRSGMEERRQDSFAVRVMRPLIERMTDPGSIMMRNVKLDDIRYRLLRAGFPYGMKAANFVVVKWLSGVIFLFVVPVAAVELFGMMGISSPLIWLIGMGYGAYLGFRIPEIWLSSVTKKRRFTIQMELPDMIDLVTISVEAGLGLYAAMQRVATRFPGPLSEEILRSLQEVRLGRSHVDSLRDLSRRAEVDDLTAFISALLQAELLGIAIANVLRVQSERLREKRRQRAREQAQKAPLKMLFPLVFLIFPALFVVILGPAMIRMRHTGFF
jgi:tight adherence protein C